MRWVRIFKVLKELNARAFPELEIRTIAVLSFALVIQGDSPSVLLEYATHFRSCSLGTDSETENRWFVVESLCRYNCEKKNELTGVGNKKN